MLITTFLYFGIHMLYNEPVYGKGTPGGIMPHTRGRLVPRYGARGPFGTILLINNYNRYCCQMSHILWYYMA